MKRTPYENARKLQAQLGTVEVAVVRRHFIPLVADSAGSSVGAQVDALLFDAHKDIEGVVKSVTVHLFDNQLDAVASYYHSGDVDDYHSGDVAG